MAFIDLLGNTKFWTGFNTFSQNLFSSGDNFFNQLGLTTREGFNTFSGEDTKVGIANSISESLSSVLKTVSLIFASLLVANIFTNLKRKKRKYKRKFRKNRRKKY